MLNRFVFGAAGITGNMKSVLVTGASSGIGAATSEHLARRGFRVFAGVRDDVSAAGVASGEVVVPVTLDVTNAASIAAAIREIEIHVGSHGLAGVVNNAGIGIPGPLELVDLDDLRRQLEVNVVGQIAVTQAVLPLLRAGHGRVVFMGSIGGKYAIEFGGPYHASKFALEGIADCLRQELRPDGIQVAIIEPGVVATPIWDKARRRVDELLAAGDVGSYADRLRAFSERLSSARTSGLDPQQVAAVVEEALTSRRPSSRYPVGASAFWGYRFKPFIPDRIYDVAVESLFRR